MSMGTFHFRYDYPRLLSKQSQDADTIRSAGIQTANLSLRCCEIYDSSNYYSDVCYSSNEKKFIVSINRLDQHHPAFHEVGIHRIGITCEN